MKPLLINGEPGSWESGNNKLDLDGIAFQDSENPAINLKINDQSLQIFRFDKLNLSVASQVAWLAHKGCKGQALQLLASKIPSKPTN